MITVIIFFLFNDAGFFFFFFLFYSFYTPTTVFRPCRLPLPTSPFSNPHSFLRNGKASHVESTSLAQPDELEPIPFPLHQGDTRQPTLWNELQKASSFTRSHWSHCQGSHRQTRMYHCLSHTEGLVWSHEGSPAVALDSVNS